MPTTTKTTRKPRVNKLATPTVTVLCRPVWPCELLPAGQAGLIEIATDRVAEPYLVLPLAGEEEHYRLTKTDGTIYHVRRLPGRWVCECRDCHARANGQGEMRLCKHAVALRQMVTPVAPDPTPVECEDDGEPTLRREVVLWPHPADLDGPF